jgi:hypothetical protein
MKIGIILTEDIDSQELERWFGGEQPLQPEEYADDGSVKVTRLEADNSVTLVTPAKQEPVAPAVKSPVRDANAPQPPAYDRAPTASATPADPRPESTRAAGNASAKP